MTERYYVAGPMRSIKRFNFPEFHRVSELLRALGHEVFNPAERDLAIGFDPTGMSGHEDLAALGFSLRDALGADTAWICREADAIVVLDGWEVSSGARAEVALARALGLPVYEWRTVVAGQPVDITAPSQLSESLPPQVHDLADVVLERTDVANEDHRSVVRGASGFVKLDTHPPAARSASDAMRAGAEREGVGGTSSRFTREAPGPGRVRNARPGTLRHARNMAEESMRARVARGEAQAHDALVDLGWTPPTDSDEVRVTSETGGSKGRKLAEMGAIDPLARMELALVAGFGGRKYERGNYLRGYAWSLCVDALYRHLAAFEAGEDRDPESGLLHAAHVAWHGLALCSFVLREIGTDDRFPADGAAA